MKKAKTCSSKANMIGPRIKAARQAAGMTQKDLCVKLELMAVYICRGSLSRIENGTRTVNDMEIDAISRAPNVPLDVLFGR